MDKKRQLSEQIRDAIDNIWIAYYDENGIENGDISPLEVLELENNIDKIAELIYARGEANKG